MNIKNRTAIPSEGCCPSSKPTVPGGDDAALAISCTLGAGDFQQRVTDIQELARRSLQTSKREGSTLYLGYDRNALADVDALVAKESECCAFLTFDLSHDASGVRLAITAPASAADALDAVFAPFAPELARQVL